MSPILDRSERLGLVGIDWKVADTGIWLHQAVIWLATIYARTGQIPDYQNL